MSMSPTLKRFLEGRALRYGLVKHPATSAAADSAAAAHVEPDRVAKSVVVESDDHYLLVAIPATHRLELGSLHRRLGRQLGLATEPEVERLFTDCAAGAVPVIGQAFGLSVLVDDALLDEGDVYVEAGDGEHLAQLCGVDFRLLMSDAAHGRFSRSAPRRGAEHTH